MLHELLLTMLGYEGDIFRLQSSLTISQEFVFIHEAEKQALNKLATLGHQYQQITSTKLDSDIFKITVKKEIDSWLDEYRSLISSLELSAMKNEINLSYIQVLMENYFVYFANILQFYERLVSAEGVQVMNLVYNQIISSGIPKIQEIYKKVLSGCLYTFNRLLVEWLSNQKPSLFVITDSPSLWLKYEVKEDQIPFFLTNQSCTDIIFIGNAISTLFELKSGSSDAKVLLGEYLKKFKDYFKDSEFSVREFLKDIYDLCQKAGILLLQAITENNDLSKQLVLFRHIYLGGVVEYLDSFIDNSVKYKKKLTDSLIPMTSSGLNQIFSDTIESVFPEDESVIMELFSLSLIENPANFYENYLFESKILLEYYLKWPVNILISEEDLESYITIFNFLLVIRLTMRQNLESWQSLKKNNVPSIIRSLVAQQTHFMNSFWAYIQMDIIDSRFEKLIFDSEEKKDITLHEMVDYHRNVLIDILKGCFLNNSPSSLEISKSIQEIIKSIQRTRAFIARFDNSDSSRFEAEAKEIESNFVFLFKVFSGIKDSSASSLSKFLIRFDFNRWFSMK
ncbi:Gamma-tubulin complex component 4 [Boothiomyces sp. JEL0866]|nr:Gamma-tubulin complex component 4 [Boothiomyces sp. JEL0866]